MDPAGITKTQALSLLLSSQGAFPAQAWLFRIALLPSFQRCGGGQHLLKLTFRSPDFPIRRD